MGLVGKAVYQLKRGASHRLVKYGSAAAFGYVKGTGKRAFHGVPIDAGVGLAALATSVFLTIKSHGRSIIGSYAGDVADAGIMSYLNSIGAAYGAKSSGRKVYVLEAGAKPPAGLKPVDVMGELPQAVGGSFLSAAEIQNFSQQR